jgi:UDP-glucose 4-epimerase
MSRVLVAGAGGYIGGRLVPALQALGVEVRGLVREPASGLEVEQVVCDLTSPDAAAVLEHACADVDAIVHLAGENEVLAAREPAAALGHTVVTTERVAEACHAPNVKRLVYMSTIHVYGGRMAPGSVLDEEMRVEPRSAYAISRLASEHVASALADEHCERVIFRLTNSVGAPHHTSVDRWTLVANDLCREAATKGTLTLRSSGTQWRDFVSLQWVCSAISAAAGVGEVEIPAGTYNLGSGEPMTVRALAEMIQDSFEQHTGTRPELHAPESEPSPPEPYYVSTARVARYGLSAPPLREAVSETALFCLDHREALR